MIGHNLLTAARSFRRNKATTAISLTCLTLGLTCFVMANGVYAYYQRADAQFPDVERIHFISQTFELSTGAAARLESVPWVIASLLENDIPELERVARLSGALELPAEIAGERRMMSVRGADPAFLHIFPLAFRSGAAAAALSRPRSAILFAHAADKLFGGENPVGRVLLLEGGVAVEITGVAELPRRPSHLHDETLQVLVSMDAYRALYERVHGAAQAKTAFESWRTPPSFRTYLLRPYGLDAASLDARLTDLLAIHAPPSATKRRLRAEHVSELSRERMTAFGESVSNVTVLLALAVLILGVACFNHSILAGAQAQARIRELGLRRVVGAGRGQIVQQLVLETTLLIVTAFATACALCVALIPVVHVQADIDLWAVLPPTPPFALGLVAALLASIVVSAAYPAAAASRRRPIEAVRDSSARDVSGFATMLVAAQFAIVGVLLVGVFVIGQQNELLRTVGLASGADQIVIIDNDLASAGVAPETLRTELLHAPHIESAAFARFAPWSGSQAMSCCFVHPQTGAKVSGLNRAVSHDYFATMGVELLAGRGFEVERDLFAPDAARSAIVVDRTTASAFGWSDPQAAVGEVIHSPGRNGAAGMRLEIIGVVADRQIEALGPREAATLYLLSARDQNVPHIRIASDNIAAGVRSIEEVWRRLAPHAPLRSKFLDERFEHSFRRFERNAQTVRAAALLAVSIAIAGLIAMALHVTQRRTREIAVRKTLGASVRRIAAMLLKDFSRPVLIANVIGWPVAFLAARAYLDLFVNRAPLDLTPFLLSLALCLVIAWACVAVQAVRAALTKPADVLRQ